MDKNEIYKTFFETIDASRDWAIDMEGDCKKYAYYIDGITDVTQRILDKLDEKNEKQED